MDRPRHLAHHAHGARRHDRLPAQASAGSRLTGPIIGKSTTAAETAHHSVRLDKWLWAARFYRTRALAADAIDIGQVRVNDQRVKPAKAVTVGDLVLMRIGGFDREVRVMIAADVRHAAPIAKTHYEETEVSLAARAAAEARRRLQREPEHSRKGRPTKRDRREIASFVDSGRDDDGF